MIDHKHFLLINKMDLDVRNLNQGLLMSKVFSIIQNSLRKSHHRFYSTTFFRVSFSVSPVTITLERLRLGCAESSFKMQKQSPF